MIPSVASVVTRVRALLDDPNGQVFDDNVVLEGYNEATDALSDAFLRHQIQKSKVVTAYTLPPNTTTLTPATAGIADFGELIWMRERTYGSTEKYTQVYQTDDLPQREPTDRLLNFEWRGDAWYFLGATTTRQLEIAYFSTSEQLATLTGNIPADGAKTFLSKYTAGIIAPRKGYYELGTQYMLEAVGSRYNDGQDGGELRRFIGPMVRTRQQVPLAIRPFRASRRMGLRRWVPYVAAQPNTGTGTAPVQLTTNDGTITGAINSANLQYFLPMTYTTVSNLSVNGVAKTQGLHYTHVANHIDFTTGNAPATGPITLDAWL